MIMRFECDMDSKRRRHQSCSPKLEVRTPQRCCGMAPYINSLSIRNCKGTWCSWLSHPLSIEYLEVCGGCWVQFPVCPQLLLFPPLPYSYSHPATVEVAQAGRSYRSGQTKGVLTSTVRRKLMRTAPCVQRLSTQYTVASASCESSRCLQSRMPVASWSATTKWKFYASREEGHRLSLPGFWRR